MKTGKILLGIVILLGVFLVPVKADAYVLWNHWLGGSNKILRYNQPGTKHSLQVAHADIHWNKQSPGTIQRMDRAANVRLYDVNKGANKVGGVTSSGNGTIEFNDYYMVRNNHPYKEEFSFMIATHEFGHALGLWHAPGSKNVMYASFGPGIVNNLPTADDRAGLLASKRRW
ncbi:matrixin family metalloprotease [Enterococcus sp. AZ126]|uniref:matrixin family metalloprotease n=1 Tax=Enterococcus sp. AZ126 TaxID=2774635 RepID=UPI003F294986